jgi:hypothetical protein
MPDLLSPPSFDARPAASESADGRLIYTAQHAAEGITRTLVEIFAVGPYKYTSLADAIAQARRDGAGK